MVAVREGGLYAVTGGSGFLGEALVSRLIKMGARVRVMARNESKLFDAQNAGAEVLAGDVADPCSVQRLLDGAEGVFHLAAYKHVRRAEEFVASCTESNVVGTAAVLQGVRQRLPAGTFVLGISTDKAAQVQGIYGATKLIMEGLFREAQELDSQRAYRIVRYGNVLYSTGSVTCIWKEAIERGDNEIILTDPEATRFYWTREQAVDLIFRCLDEATGAEPFVPEMKAARLGDLVNAMLINYGDRRRPSIRTIGLQPGENMHERMLENGPFSNEVPLFSLEELRKMVGGPFA